MWHPESTTDKQLQATWKGDAKQLYRSKAHAVAKRMHARYRAAWWHVRGTCLEELMARGSERSTFA